MINFTPEYQKLLSRATWIVCLGWLVKISVGGFGTLTFLESIVSFVLTVGTFGLLGFYSRNSNSVRQWFGVFLIVTMVLDILGLIAVWFMPLSSHPSYFLYATLNDLITLGTFFWANRLTIQAKKLANNNAELVLS
jgi:hypothetical protein